MSKDYIIAPNHIRYELEEAERAVVAVSGILEDVIDPTFKGCTCRGLLDAWSEETNGDRGAAALKWMEQNFDAIPAIWNSTLCCRRFKPKLPLDNFLV